MWSRQLFIVWVFALTILATQSHVIHKRGLLSKLFGGNSKSTHNVEGDLPPRERSRFRELLKNPVVVAMIGAAVGMIVQKALAERNMKDVCENKYVKMADSAGNMTPEIQQALKLLGCDGSNRQTGSSTIPGNQFPTTTRSAFSDDEDNEEESYKPPPPGGEEEEGTLESALPPEKESRIQQLLSIARGEKGAKRNFLKNLFGLNRRNKTFKQGQKLPSSSYKLDKDDANAIKDLEQELEQFNRSIN